MLTKTASMRVDVSSYWRGGDMVRMARYWVLLLGKRGGEEVAQARLNKVPPNSQVHNTA